MQELVAMNATYALISGASQGIGRAIAEKLLESGCHLAICSRSQSDLDQLQSEWKQQYPAARILAFAADLAQAKEVTDFANKVLAEFPEIHLLVNNAGVFQAGDLATEPEGQLESMMQVNLYSAYHLTRAVLPVMKTRAHIFNMCSVASLKAYPNGGAYSISKFALMGFSENLREELKPQKIKVTAICPGATWSRSWSGSGIQPQRIMEAKDIAEMLWAAYKLSPSANVETIIMRPVSGDL